MPSSKLAAKAYRAIGVAFTVMLRPTVVLPPVLVAVTVYVAVAATAVGVPLMTPVEVLRLRPAGSAGETDQVTTGPPLTVGVLTTMAVPRV